MTKRVDANTALRESDTTMLRIVEAVVRGKTTLNAPEVKAWVAHRRALRKIGAGGPGAIPEKPPYISDP